MNDADGQNNEVPIDGLASYSVKKKDTKIGFLKDQALGYFFSSKKTVLISQISHLFQEKIGIRIILTSAYETDQILMKLLNFPQKTVLI